MSTHLWRYFFEDDVDRFQQFLADATLTASAAKTGGIATTASSKIAGSPGTLSTSPRISLKPRKSSGVIQYGSSQGKATAHMLTRADINAKDTFGRTLLHHIASSPNPRAFEYLAALLEIPFVDLYAQDLESGWTALHRALYFGNIAITQALMLRDIKDATDYTTNAAHTHAGGLVKIKDHEGNSPFEVFGSTIAPRSLTSNRGQLSIGSGDEDDISDGWDDEQGIRERQTQPLVNLAGDEVFAFGSNKNYSLGLGDNDDRQYPERISLARPTPLLRRLHGNMRMERQLSLGAQDLTSSRSLSVGGELPALVQFQPFTFQDVVMAKMHTAVLTDDPVANLYICGFGTWGRLGTGDEVTRFSYTSIDGGGLASRRIVAVALGQDHSIAVTSRGEVFTWGANQHSQLGYELPEVSAQEMPMQLIPRQLYGHVKRELIIGAAASSIHSAIFTSSALYMFGRNEGQLGLMDADARSLEMQVIPRRVGVSVLKAPIEMVSSIERATSVLLENHDLIVFTHYGWTRIVFQLEGFINHFMSSDTFSTRHNAEGMNAICKVTSASNTICALSTFGEVFTIDVPRRDEALSTTASTTNPAKARNALPTPARVWSIKKSHTRAIDVAVTSDSSIALCTAAGTVWRKEKRAKIKSMANRDAMRSKDYKFVRIPNLTRAVAIRSNGFGAFTTVRKDSDVTREQIVVDAPALWEDLFRLLPFRQLRPSQRDEDSVAPQPRFWTPTPKATSPAQIRAAVLTDPTVEDGFKSMMESFVPLSESQYDMWITSDTTDVQIPVHAFLLKARSAVMLQALTEFQSTYYFSIPAVVSVEYDSEGQVCAQFPGADVLTILNLVFYLYTDTVVDVWHHTSRALHMASRYRQVRVELMKIAAALQMPQLERAVRIMTEPVKTLQLDVENVIHDENFFADADLLIELADDVEVPAHSVMLGARCPFFDGFFHGRAGGRWMANRQTAADGDDHVVKVDLKHMGAKTFELVLRHIYADTGDELFDDVVTKDLDEFVDLLIEVMSAANELMLDRLAQVCQRHLGRYVTTRNVCSLLNVVAECSVNEFKHAAFEYMCLNLETMLEHRLLEELDADLLVELDEVVRQNQLAYMPFARSSRVQDGMFEQHPELIQQIEVARQRRIDSMRLRSRLNNNEEDRPTGGNKFRVGSFDGPSSLSSTPQRSERSVSEDPSPSPSPAIAPSDRGDDTLFEMDEDHVTAEHGAPPGLDLGNSALEGRVSRSHPEPDLQQSQSPGATRGETFFTKSAWGRPSQTPSKLNLRDVLQHASSSNAATPNEKHGVGSPSSSRTQPKMSQKERKKMQKEHLQARTSEPTTIPTSLVTASVSAVPPVSPWQKVEPRRSSSAQHDLPVEQSDVNSTAATAASNRLPARPGMTMRQTVAGTPPLPTKEQSRESRRVSSPGVISMLTPRAPQIQSIRHTPLPATASSSLDAQTSMSEILAQQQFEKTAVKEAVAKRSLQEIQQEQEFQQWWDTESQRVQNEEARAKTTGNRRGKGGRGRADKRRGSGRGVSVNASDATQQPMPETPATAGGKAPGRGRGRGVKHS